MLLKVMPTRCHGYLDYLTAGALLVLPKALGLSPKVTALMQGAALGTVAYSLATRYELGLVKALPMKTHLALDALSGAGFIAAGALLDEPESTRGLLGAIGAFELGAALTTQTEPVARNLPEAIKVAHHTDAPAEEEQLADRQLQPA